MLQKLFIGTSGWSYSHWSEIFYPRDIKPAQYLEYYITQFGCVELNSCFYHLPLESTVRGWLKRTPPSFRLCPKVSRYITHESRLLNIEEPLKKFFELFSLMKERLGPVLVQFPPDLHYDESLTFGFLRLIRTMFSEYRFAIEVRHQSWINDRFFDLLSRYGIAFVIADSGKRYPYSMTVTADFIYLRFHGPEQLYSSDYSEEYLKACADRISGWLSEGKDVWVFFNNDFYGYAIKNARMLKEFISRNG